MSQNFPFFGVIIQTRRTETDSNERVLKESIDKGILRKTRGASL